MDNTTKTKIVIPIRPPSPERINRASFLELLDKCDPYYAGPMPKMPEVRYSIRTGHFWIDDARRDLDGMLRIGPLEVLRLMFKLDFEDGLDPLDTLERISNEWICKMIITPAWRGWVSILETIKDMEKMEAANA